MNYQDRILPADQAKLRIHGNGFLQAETTCGNKFHVWDERLPRQKVQTLLHNHNHGFRSTLLIGDLRWVEYGINVIHFDLPWLPDQPPAGIFQAHQCVPRKGKDTELEPMGVMVELINKREFNVTEGSVYDWPLDMNLYHEVHPVFFNERRTRELPRVVTFVERGEYCDEEPTVLVPLGVNPDNEFDRYAHDQIARDIYTQAMDLVRHIK